MAAIFTPGVFENLHELFAGKEVCCQTVTDLAEMYAGFKSQLSNENNRMKEIYTQTGYREWCVCVIKM